jgi:hypothetical protein
VASDQLFLSLLKEEKGLGNRGLPALYGVSR